MIDYSFVVEPFTEAMKAKMTANSHKGDMWKNEMTADALLVRVQEELNELVQAVAYGVDPEFVLAEAADVANMAMMVADNYKLRYK